MKPIEAAQGEKVVVYRQYRWALAWLEGRPG
jgi:hypothetical protein